MQRPSGIFGTMHMYAALAQPLNDIIDHFTFQVAGMQALLVAMQAHTV